MKRHFNPLMAYLSTGAFILLAPTAHGAEAYTDSWAYQDYPNQTTLTNLTYSSTLQDDNSTMIIVTGGSHMDGDICGALSADKVSATHITLNGGSDIKRIIGGHSSYNYVDGDIDITVNDGEAQYIYGGNWYVENGREETNNPDKYIDGYNNEETFGVKSSTGVWVPKKSTGNIRITINGGTIDQIRGGHNCAENSTIDPDITPDIGWYVDDSSNVTDKRPYSVGGNVYIELNGGTVGTGSDAIRGAGGSWCSVDGIVYITVNDTAMVNGNIYAGARNVYGQVGGTNVYIQGGTIIGNVYGGGSYDTQSAISQSDTNVKVSGGNITGNIYGAGKRDIVEGASNVVIEGGNITGSVYGGGNDSRIAKGSNVTLSGGTVSGAIYGTGQGDTVNGDVTVKISGGDWSRNSIYALADGATITNGETYLIIGDELSAYNGSVQSYEGFKHLVVHSNSSLDMSGGNIFAFTSQTITLSEANLRQAAISGGSAAIKSQGVTLHLRSSVPLGSGTYKVASINTSAPTGWNEQNVKVSGLATFSNLYWVGNTLYFSYEAPHTNAAAVSNWGVFKSSQAFTGILRGNRGNCILLNKEEVISDAKSGHSSPPHAVRKQAWGTVYGQSGRISGSGADYSLYGAAIGAEQQIPASHSSIGVAFGYDWGKVNPFTTTTIEQESWHAALYGRLCAGKLAKGCILLDWSAAYGNTTSEHNNIAGDWRQDSWQFDARATYVLPLTERISTSVFVGMQYYTHDNAYADGIHISSMQNLRLETGAGLSYAASARTNVYGQAGVYIDAMRHNPHAVENGIRLQGENPGRIGGMFSVGADYAITDQWSLCGFYGFDVAEHSTEHNINAGVQYQF